MTPLPHEQTRARYPDESGYAERGGVKLHYEVYGSGEPTVLLLPTWSIIYSRHWKMQIPYLARHCRVVTFDGRGNGRSDRPEAGYDEREFAADALAVMDATGTGRAVIVSLSLGAQRALLLAAGHPDRVAGAVFIAPFTPLGSFDPPFPWDEELSTGEGWAKWNRHYWLRDYRGFLEFFFSQMFNEPHSTKPAEDCVGWGLETTAETLVATELGGKLGEEETRELWIGDESWELDYYLHENPERKRAAYAWFTDFVGWLPMADGGPYEAFLTADYNAEMIEHIARFPRVRDRAIFVGDPDDIVPDAFGAGLPLIRDWTERHYDFAGYVTGFDPRRLADRRALGYREDERVCIVTVGGSGVGGHLLRRVIAAFPEARERVPGLRMIVVAGPRIDPGSLPAHDGLEILPYVHELYRHLAVCDLAVVQGGLTTTMELTANRRPFIYFPLRHHFEQNFHVRHRLERYRAGRCMDYATAGPADIADAIASEIGREVDYRPVATDGAARAAALLAELL